MFLAVLVMNLAFKFQYLSYIIADANILYTIEL